jgi:succinate dehydrogenase / fumarate reductase, flavoprotein subunit
VNIDGSAGGPFVHLDLRHMGKEKILSRVPFAWEEAHRLVGIDAVYEPMPVRPTVHYSMGGIPINTDGRVRLSATGLTEGFFSAGEAACVSVHGANRLGSNSLLECVVYGRRVGASIARYVQDRRLPAVDAAVYLQEAQATIQGLLDGTGEYRINEIRTAYQDCMTEYCGVFRTEERMKRGLVALKALQEKAGRIQMQDRGQVWNGELIEAMELRSLLLVGEVILTSALARQESRGSHYRDDFPARDDQGFLHHSLVNIVEGAVVRSTMPVVIDMFEPMERKY